MRKVSQNAASEFPQVCTVCPKFGATCEEPAPVAGGDGLMCSLKMWSSSALRGAEMLCQFKKGDSKPNPNPNPPPPPPRSQTLGLRFPLRGGTMASVYRFLGHAEINPGQLFQGWKILSRKKFFQFSQDEPPLGHVVPSCQEMCRATGSLQRQSWAVITTQTHPPMSKV